MSTFDLTPQDRRDRAAALGEAIEKWSAGMGFEGILGDWIVVGAMVRVDDDGDPNADYFIGFSGGTMLQHVALGLMSKGDEMLSDGTATEDG